ncbi:hypothetical protein FN3523_1322 [Francisella hispaniensis]|uniref:Uncharacterized protein n=1 Tax=Francisella hispaniensis TaxID=622488 RepID=F4BGN1_9GAMM|nr:hypothetical protein FN3523_1322 [Francisella hispaniensis]
MIIGFLQQNKFLSFFKTIIKNNISKKGDMLNIIAFKIENNYKLV